jgi:acyl-coenzyme A thioesterase PaaI-like protein
MSCRVTSKAYGTVSTERQKEMSGLEFVQGLADGTLPLNTMAETLGYDVSEAASGRVVVTAVPDRGHLNPAGTVHGGLAATMLDSCMGLAIHSTLEKGVVQRHSNSRFRCCGRSHPKRARSRRRASS